MRRWLPALAAVAVLASLLAAQADPAAAAQEPAVEAGAGTATRELAGPADPAAAQEPTVEAGPGAAGGLTVSVDSDGGLAGQGGPAGAARELTVQVDPDGGLAGQGGPVGAARELAVQVDPGGGLAGQGGPAGAAASGAGTGGPTLQVQGQQSSSTLKVCAGPSAADDCTALTSTSAGSQTFTLKGTGWSPGIPNPLYVLACLVPASRTVGDVNHRQDCDLGGLTRFLPGTGGTQGSQALGDPYSSQSAFVPFGVGLISLSAGAFSVDMTVDVPSAGVVISAVITSDWTTFSPQVNRLLAIASAAPALEGLAADASTANQVTLSWTEPDACDGASPACIYQVRHKEKAAAEPDPWDWTTVTTTSSTSSGTTTLSATVTGLDSGVEYDFEVQALPGAQGSEDVQAEGSVTATTLDVPSPPTSLIADPNEQKTRYDLAWTAPAADTARAAVTGYRIEHSADGDTGWAALATAGSSATAHSDTGLTAGTDRYYRVVATSAAGDSDPSNISPRPPPVVRVYLKPDASTAADTSGPVVESVPRPGTHHFTVVGRHWTGLHSGTYADVLFITACLFVPDASQLRFFEQCDSNGLHTFAGVPNADAGSQDLSELYASDAALRTLAGGIGATLQELNVASDGSFSLDLAVNVPIDGVIINAAVGTLDIGALRTPNLIALSRTATAPVTVATIGGVEAVAASDRVALSWSNEDFCNATSPACSYWVRHKETADGDDSWSAWADTGWTSGSPAYTVTGLDELTSYDFEIERREGTGQSQVVLNRGSVSVTTPVTPPLALTVDRSPSEADDGNTPADERVATLTATLAQPATAPVTVTLTVDPASTATLGTDFTLSPTTITIARGATTGTATVTAVDDDLGEGEITVDGDNVVMPSET
ncbi:MAG: fibronectin type III domain-containing protein, partial [Acidimicrobiaceae bacterium]|nr:fibronectin type III domain-containing protein [Acidimicrobiaceae bacterium]